MNLLKPWPWLLRCSTLKFDAFVPHLLFTSHLSHRQPRSNTLHNSLTVYVNMRHEERLEPLFICIHAPDIHRYLNIDSFITQCPLINNSPTQWYIDQFFIPHYEGIFPDIRHFLTLFDDPFIGAVLNRTIPVKSAQALSLKQLNYLSLVAPKVSILGQLNEPNEILGLLKLWPKWPCEKYVPGSHFPSRNARAWANGELLEI